MLDDLVRGRLLALVAVVALLAAAWRADEIVPSAGLPRWAAVPAALLLGIYLHQGYRGFRWIVAVLLVAAGAAAVYRLGVSRPLHFDAKSVGLALLAGVFFSVGPVTARSSPVSSFLAYQRDRRTDATPIFLAVVWIVVLAMLAVWLFVRAGLQVL
jgi:hypothetical protein